MTQESLAKVAGLTASAVCRYERGDAAPSYPSLEKLANGLSISVVAMLLPPPQDDSGETAESIARELIREELRRTKNVEAG